ncbi:MAG: phytanoyl-CoA dioxygenase family protein [Hyphomicrobiales bacterium]
MLTEEQISSYRNNGYLVVENVFGQAELAELNRVTDSFVERSRTVPASDATFDLAPDHDAEAPRVRRIKDPHAQHPAYAAAMRNSDLVAILESLIGPGVRFDHSKLNIKPVSGGAAIEWHQDWAFYPHTNDDILAVGVLLEDCFEENGPLMVIPGSHKGPVYNHHSNGTFVGACNPHDLGNQIDHAVALTGPAGSCTFHHVRTLHASSENRGARERRLLLFSYAAVDAWPLVDTYELGEFNSRILTGEPTWAPRQVQLPVRIPLPRVEGSDSIFDDQAAVLGRSFDT